MKNKLLGLLLTLTLVFALIPVYANADNYQVVVSVNSNQVTVTGGNASYAGKALTLRVVDSYSRNILADQVKAAANGNYSFGPYTLENGNYTAWVGGMDVAESKAFSVTQSPAEGTNANLKSLQLSSAPIEFSADQTDYTASVANRVSRVTVTANAEDVQAIVRINNEEMATKDIDLKEGVNAVSIEVTAQDGVTKKKYNLTIKRAIAITAASGEAIQVSTEPVSITVPSDASNVSIKVEASTVGSTKQALLPLIDVQAVTSLGAVDVSIPQGTQITAPDSWDGTIKLPEVLSNSSVSISDGSVSAVIEVGLPDVTLTFDKAVRLLLPNQGDKSVGYVRNGAFTPITGSISEDSQTVANRTITAGGDAKIKVGSDLVVWTKHFTKFASYTPVTRNDNGSSGSGSSGGGTPSNEGTITAVGGTLTLNGAKIDVPAGALANSIKVTVDKVSDTSMLPVDLSLKLISGVYEIKKDQEGDFNKSVVITLPFDKTAVDFAKSLVGVYWLNEQTHTWVQLDDLQVDQVNATASGSVKHFTKFAVLVSDKKAVHPDGTSLIDIKGHWAEANIRELVKQGAINGYSDNSFKPDNKITRAEFVTVIVKALNLKAQDGKSFEDTSTHWAKGAIAIAAALGVVNGYTEQSFGPEDFITREQMAAIIIRAAQLEPIAKNIDFSDSSSVSDWARSALATAIAKDLVNGYEDHTVKPQANTTRAEAVTVILRALALKK
ncbi:S-layer homology domain-containing protein [Paenibacillus alba]|uniref:S-layer homology domain-containing protein n=1 Tax=Paenibacillus alba TaxID=1197127 RepID=A0ABU6FXE4_9BACL|nr:S-layer homology domain-containing protein [Paenibacillus alba]MEC0226578.1 S-layer homology domain-containing protein [Paenibacillus alba]